MAKAKAPPIPKAPKTEKRVLSIPLLNGKEWTVDCEIIGDLAIHAHYKDRNRWSITHVPTGLHIRNGIPPAVIIAKREVALAWMAKVQEGDAVKKDWMLMRRFTTADVLTDPEHSKGMRERLMRHCLETLP